MADFLVLEEDGTSHLELEDSSSDFLLEESSPFEKTGAGVAGASTAADYTPVPSPSAPSTWKAGTLTVPSGASTVAVTGLPKQPKAVFFFGTNWLAEDSVDTSIGTGLFRGMAGPKWDDPGTILQNAASVIPPGNAHKIDNSAILMTTPTGGVLYQADLTSLDAHGFSVDFTTGVAGGYKVVYVALFGPGEVGSYAGPEATVTLGWKAGSMMMHGAWGGVVNSGGNRTQEFYGSAAYPGSSTNWKSAGLSEFSFPTSSGHQFLIEIFNQAPTTIIAHDISFSGPFLSPQNVTAYPTGTGLTNFRISFNESSTEGVWVAWNDDDSTTGRRTPADADGGTSTVTGLSFEPGLVIGYSVGNEPQNQQSESSHNRGAIGFSVATQDFQWCAMADGYSNQGAYQSYQRGFCDNVSGAAVGAHAGTIELTDDGFIMTTDEDSFTPAMTWVWHAFGHPQPNPWIPQIYRLLVTA